MGFWEAGMLVCFGFSWPFSILKTIRAKNPAGKSNSFIFLVEIGYICGLLSKFERHHWSGGEVLSDWVAWLYLLNFAMVATDFILMSYYRRRGRRAAANVPTAAPKAA